MLRDFNNAPSLEEIEEPEQKIFLSTANLWYELSIIIFINKYR